MFLSCDFSNPELRIMKRQSISVIFRSLSLLLSHFFSESARSTLRTITVCYDFSKELRVNGARVLFSVPDNSILLLKSGDSQKGKERKGKEHIVVFFLNILFPRKLEAL